MESALPKKPLGNLKVSLIGGQNEGGKMKHGLLQRIRMSLANKLRRDWREDILPRFKAGTIKSVEETAYWLPSGKSVPALEIVYSGACRVLRFRDLNVQETRELIEFLEASK